MHQTRFSNAPESVVIAAHLRKISGDGRSSVNATKESTKSTPGSLHF
jgi:hypothetical protein